MEQSGENQRKSSAIGKDERRAMNGHHSFVMWFTGLSGAGKSTLANALERKLYDIGLRTYILDGDAVRTGLNRDLGFGAVDRNENIRRIGEAAKLFVDAGMIVLTAAISPYKTDRESARALVEPGEFVEIYVKCPLEECEKRDPKGLYKKARSGAIKEFTGISAPYEPPVNPEIIIETHLLSIGESVDRIMHYLTQTGTIGKA